MTPSKRRRSNKVAEEIQEFHKKLDEFEVKLDTLEGQVATLDDDFRKHEEAEKTLLDEVLVAVLQNTESTVEIKKNISSYIELQEDLSVLLRVIKKITTLGTVVGKFIIVIGLSGTLVKFIYEWFTKGMPGL